MSELVVWKTSIIVRPLTISVRISFPYKQLGNNKHIMQIMHIRFFNFIIFLLFFRETNIIENLFPIVIIF